MFKFESIFKKAPKEENIPESVSALIRQKIINELGSNNGHDAQKLDNYSNYKSLSEREEALFQQKIKDPKYVKNVIQEIKDRENMLKKDKKDFDEELNKIKEHHLRKKQRFTHGENVREALKSHIEEKYSNEDKNI